MWVAMADRKPASDPETAPPFFSEEGAGSEHVSGDPTPDPAADPDPEYEAPTEDEFDALQQQLAAAQERESRFNEQLGASQRLVSEALGAGGRPSASPPPKPEPPLGPMPDSAIEPAKFQEWLDARDAIRDRRVVTAMQGLRSEFSQDTKANDLFHEFVQRYPAMASERDLVDLAARQAGVAVTDTPESIFEKTSKRLIAMGIQLETESVEDPDDPEGIEHRTTPPKTIGAPRTAGVGRGSGRARRRKKDVEKPPVDLLDAITDEQIRMGI